MLKRIFDDIFIKLILIMISLVMITFLWKGTVVAKKSLFLLFIISCLYIKKCFQANQLDRNNDYVRIILIVREIIQFFGYFFIYIFIKIEISKILCFFIPAETVELLEVFYQYVIIYKFFLSSIAIILGVKLFKFIGVLLFIIIPIIAFIGAFDVKWWAAVTGLLALWNYINSKDFLVFLRNGKNIKNAPLKLEYVWQRNKLFANMGTVIFYISLVISSFFEKECMTFIERAVPRIYSLTGITVFLSFVYLFLLIYFAFSYRNYPNGRFGKFILWIGKKLKLEQLTNLINLYKIAMKKKE